MTETLTRADAPPVDVGRSAPPPAERYLKGPSPWRRSDALIAALVAAIGVAGLTVCQQGAADELRWRDQLDWVFGAALFTALFVLAVAGWVLIGMRRLRRGFRVLMLRREVVLGLEEQPSIDVSAEFRGELVRAEPMQRVHRPTCLLLRGKRPVVVPADRVDAYERCGVCRS